MLGLLLISFLSLLLRVLQQKNMRFQEVLLPLQCMIWAPWYLQHTVQSQLPVLLRLISALCRTQKAHRKIFQSMRHGIFLNTRILPDVQDLVLTGDLLPQEVQTHQLSSLRYSSTGGMYVTASKDGAVRLWDGVTANCVRSIVGAHGTAEVTSAIFTKDQRFVLSSGKDSTVKLWEVGSGTLAKQYLGATHTQLRSQAIFNDTEEFVLSVYETSNEIVIWDAFTAEKVARWPSNHNGAPRWIEHSPIEASFISCGSDRSVRFWKETL